MIQAEVEFSQYGGAGITVFGRDKDGNRFRKANKFIHYFYAPDKEGNYTTLFGDKVKRISVNKFWLAKEKIQMYDKTYESDLNYVKRFLVDHGDDFISESEPRKVFWDIETTSLDSDEGIIISIITYDSYNKKYTEFIHAPDLECKTERDMLIEFAEYINYTQPDIMSGWNCSKFDVPFLLNRMNACNVPIGKLSPMNRVDRYFTNMGEQNKIRGIALIDMLVAYKKMSENELETYRLDYVAETELGRGKDEISVLPGKLWERGDYDKLLLYNRRDVEILAELDKKLGIIQYLDEVATVVSCDISETLYNSRIVDSYILKQAVKRGIVLPSKDFTRKRSDYTGAFVFTPEKGIHDKVAVFDYASLYPSLIISNDISPETIRSTDSGSTYTVERGDEPGFIPSILENILTLRKKYKEQGEDNKQRVMKEIANSFYGVMAYPSFRLYTPAMASMITEKGREIIQLTKEIVESDSDYRIIYGDTDSVIVKGLDNTKEAVKLETNINKAIEKYAEEQGIIDNRLHIEFETYATRALMIAKKRYAMKTDKNEYIIKGLQMVRSDAQQKTKEFQEKIIHKILDGATDKDIRNYYNSEKDKIIAGNSLYGLAIPRKFSKPLEEYANNVAVQAAEFSNDKFDKNIGAGDKIVFYHIKSSPTGTKAIALELGEKLPNGYIVDVKLHWKRIEKAIRPLLDDLDILEKTKQTGLDAFL